MITDNSKIYLKELANLFEGFSEFIYFPSIDWHHSWERQQTLISNFSDAHSQKPGVIVHPSGLIDYAPWRLENMRLILSPEQLLDKGRARAKHTINKIPVNLEYVKPLFPRGTNPFFSTLAIKSSSTLKKLLVPKGRRLVFASYVNSLVERYLENADFIILDLAERRQLNPNLSQDCKEMERYWAGRANLLVADNIATIEDYAKDRQIAGMYPGQYIPQGFEPPGNIYIENRKNKKIAAYLGNLHNAIDYDYFLALIATNPEWTFKICGQLMCHRANELLRQQNVIYKGVISKNEISNFLSDVSIGLIPYLRNDWTAGVFPTKLFEYLGHYVHVLSTGIPEVVNFSNLDFINISDTPVRLRTPLILREEIDSFISSHTWSARMSEYVRCLNCLLN